LHPPSPLGSAYGIGTHLREALGKFALGEFLRGDVESAE
jgi:hypothetical protein